MLRTLLVSIMLVLSGSAMAHEVRPGYVELIEVEPELYSVSWKQPVREGGDSVTGLGLRLVLPPNCTHRGESKMVRRTGALIEQFNLQCEAGLEGRTLGMEGLQRTITDVFVRLTAFSGEISTYRLTAEQPAIVLRGGGAELKSYFSLGVEHLLTGYDHILFVIGISLLAARLSSIFWMVTAFTLAHSITLALSVLGILRLPSAPVEAVIALSILFVAVEIMLLEQQRSYIARTSPQLIAFAFGLVHGFGFAGVLIDIGMPRGETAWALALFNIGLEAGQLMIVAAVLVAMALAQRFLSPAKRQAGLAATSFVIGAVASYWVITRASAIVLPLL
jgi:hydrogenase/urease accessory protein HupE